LDLANIVDSADSYWIWTTSERSKKRSRAIGRFRRPTLRQWFGHDPGKWEEFKKRYEDELNHNSEAVAQLRAHLAQGTVTLVYGAKDQEHNDAVVLQEYLRKRA